MAVTLSEASALLARRALSPVELTEGLLARIEAVDGSVRAFAATVPERALADAREAERELAAGRPRGPLHGIPIALKDLVATAGIPTAAGSRVLDGWVPERTATVARRLEEAGTVLLGKATTHEFAFDVYTPPTRNPWDLERIPGGSSGGSAAALAAGLCLGAIGTDTAGSIRIPAALCGVSGLKPTYGRVSRAGVVPFSWSLDHVGPMARTAADLALLLQATAGADPDDPTSAAEPVPDYAAALTGDVRGLRLGVPEDFYWEHVDAAAAAAAETAVAVLRELGAVVRPVRLPRVHLAPIAGDAISFPEVSLYHRRWIAERAARYEPATLANLHLGGLFLATDYLQAQRVRRLVTEELLAVLGDVDAVVAPTTPVAAIRADERAVRFADGYEESALYAYCRLTYPANVTGLPALSVPCGATAAGLPLGLQLVGRPFDEALLLALGDAYQRATDWHTPNPEAAAMTDTPALPVSEALRIPSAEFAERRRRARALAAERGLAGLVVWSRNATTADWYGDVMYLTNHHSPFPQLPDNPPAWAGRSHSVLVLPVDGEPVLVIDTVEPRRDLLEVDELRIGFDVPATVAKVLREVGLAGERLGLVGRDSLLHASWRGLVEGLGGTPRLEAADDLLAGLRRRKSEAELRVVRHAAAVGVECMTAMLEAVRAGVTEGDVVGEGLRAAARLGAWPYDVAVASGPHAERFQWARLPSWDWERPLEAGDLVHVDLWGPVLGYYTDFVRSTVVGGVATAAQRELLDGAVELVEHVLAGLRPGVSFGALWERGDGWLSAHGFAVEPPDDPDEATLEGMFPGFGHGIGLGVEGPYLMRGVEDVAEPGMVVAVEILLTRPGVGGAGFEQDVVVTADGYELLTGGCPARWWS